MSTKKKLLIILPCVVVLLAAAFAAWVLWANTALVRTDYTVASERLPREFDGFVIAQVADLHNAEYDEGNQKLLSMLQDAKPDIIVLTGDTIDARNPNVPVVLDFLQKAMQIAPCYFVTGNHECALNRMEYYEIEAQMREIGVDILRAEAVKLERGDASITLLGVDDENFEGTLYSSAQLRELAGTDGYTILLSHRPEYFWRYAEAQIDLTFSGHAHGGQVRLPLIGGLYAPGQGVLPEYDCGVYTYQNSSMVVSRGIGKSSFPLRFNNRPELVIVTLTSQDN
ncbi:MAG: metallophosphoesterase [Clostridia bacterium]|nr:metallophosphoesterase [Clostridia bacterium]